MSVKPLPSERRQNTRTPLMRPAKVRCRQTGKYYQGRTCNVSNGGALVEIDHPSLMVAGQSVQLGVAWTSRNMLLGDHEMIDATILRSLGMAGNQRIAIRFDQRQQLAMTA